MCVCMLDVANVETVYVLDITTVVTVCLCLTLPLTTVRYLSTGQPYNQLAILEVNRNNKLASVFYYIRSLSVRHPFPVAATNLEKFYAKMIRDKSVVFQCF